MSSPSQAPAHVFHIVVNGRAKTVNSDLVSFEQAVALAFDPVPTGENVVFTVTYRNAAGHKADGTLTPGQSIQIKNGTIFNVTATDKS